MFTNIWWNIPAIIINFILSDVNFTSNLLNYKSLREYQSTIIIMPLSGEYSKYNYVFQYIYNNLFIIIINLGFIFHYTIYNNIFEIVICIVVTIIINAQLYVVNIFCYKVTSIWLKFGYKF